MRNIKKIAWLIILVVGIYVLFKYLLPLVIPFVIAGVVATIYYPFLRKIYRKSQIWESRRKTWVLVLSVVLLYLVLFVLCGWIFGYVFGECHSIWLNLPFYKARLLGVLQSCCSQLDVFLQIEQGKSYLVVEEWVSGWEEIKLEGMLPKVTTFSVNFAKGIFGLVLEIVVTIMATVYLIRDYELIRDRLLASRWGSSVYTIVKKCKDTLKIYLKAQGLIMLVDVLVCTIAFFLINQPYYLVLGPLVAVLDALPILGAGILLLPYAIYVFLTAQWWKGFVVLLAYVGCVLVRQFTEPRMIGNQLEIRPIATLLGMYLGFRLFGVVGVLLGPVGILIGQEVYGIVNKNNFMEDSL